MQDSAVETNLDLESTNPAQVDTERPSTYLIGALSRVCFYLHMYRASVHTLMLSKQRLCHENPVANVDC
jgi:hypothetical protein